MTFRKSILLLIGILSYSANYLGNNCPIFAPHPFMLYNKLHISYPILFFPSLKTRFSKIKLDFLEVKLERHWRATTQSFDFQSSERPLPSIE